MDVGITVMLTDRAIDPARLARACEERGFSSLYLPEHTHLPVEAAEPPVLIDGVQLEDYPRSLDPYIALATAASVTTRLRLGTGVSLIAQHDPIVLAKQIATLDHLSGGRVILGVGLGWNRIELAHHGVEFARRREVLEDKLRCMGALWSCEVAEHHGEFVDLAPSYAWPKPVQQPRVRTLFGGGAGDKLFRLIAAVGDGWMPVGGGGVAKNLPRLREAFEAAGRDPSTIHVVPFGSFVDEGKLEYYRSIGVTEVVLRVRPPHDEASVLRALDELAQFVPDGQEGALANGR